MSRDVYIKSFDAERLSIIDSACSRSPEFPSSLAALRISSGAAQVHRDGAAALHSCSWSGASAPARLNGSADSQENVDAEDAAPQLSSLDCQ